MAKDSKIQWTDHTWNIAVGCSKVDADCKYCYMYRQSLNNTRYKPDEVRKTKTVFNMPLKIKEPSKIFVSSLTDVFHPDCDSFRNEMWDIIRKCPQHTFQILTKRPERIDSNLPPDWGDGWDNVWLGTSIGSQQSISRMIELCNIKSKVKFLSLEPLHGKINLLEPCVGLSFCANKDLKTEVNALVGIDWIIVGGESGNDNGKYRYRPCKIKWIEDIIYDAKIFKVPVFVKQLGTHLAKEMKLKDRHGGDMDEWPENLKIRQFPTT